MSSKFKVLITDYGFDNVNEEKKLVENAGGELHFGQYKTEEEIIAAADGVDAIIVQFSELTARVIKSLKNCKVIVRCGIGYDNVDLKTAMEMGIIVCNVPDYCIDEVADHTLALGLTLARQVVGIDKRTRKGIFKMAPITPMPAFKDMIFATMGLGRIAQQVLERAKGFGFTLAAYDPFVENHIFEEKGIIKMDLETLFRKADILSLNIPLTPETKYIINGDSLAKMKNTSIILNTSRGGLIDTQALASALQNNMIGYAGLDVFENEPLENDSPILNCKNAILTSHVAFYSEASLMKLQKMAAEEVVRCLVGEKVKNRVA
tara:strand:+ start:13898 stop:14857 length:960 start_codon:yes stop_codon:yes gene_type:complete